MSDFLIAFLATLSVATWVYTKALRRSGGNTKNAATVAAMAGVATFIVMMTILSIVGSKLQNQ